MSYTQPNADATATTDNGRRTLYIIIGTITLLLLGGLMYLKSRPDTGGAVVGEQRLENGLRAGSPEFDDYIKRIRVDDPIADEGMRPIGDWWMNLRTTVRNFTGRTINGLEMHASVVDLQNKPVKERTVIIVPNRQTGLTELEPNKTMPVSIALEGMKKTDVRANIKMEITAIKFK